MASKYSFCTRSTLSLRNSGSRRRSSNALNTSSKSAFRHDQEMVVESAVLLVAGLALGASGAPDFAVDIDQADFVSGLGAGAAANPGYAVDERQFVVLLQKDDHAIRQDKAVGFLGMKRRE